MITAKAAKALSAKHWRAKNKSLMAAMRDAKRRAKADEPKVAKALIDLAAVRIENATLEGNYQAFVEVPDKNVGRLVAEALLRRGFTARVCMDTRFTGVDEWDEILLVRISWSPEDK